MRESQEFLRRAGCQMMTKQRVRFEHQHDLVTYDAAVGGTSERQRLGAWYTPQDLVDTVVANVVTAEFVALRMAVGAAMKVLDPACGDGRFLAAAGRRIRELGGTCELVGVDIDPAAVYATASLLPEATTHCEDALERTWGSPSFDVVLGNPPFLSQLAAATTRSGSSSRGGGPYADAAAEFLVLASEVVDSNGGRVALVLPQSLLSSRDAGDARQRIDDRARMFWSWWTGERVFDAQVHTCALAFEFSAPTEDQSPRQKSQPTAARSPTWSHVVASRIGVPSLPDAVTELADGTLGDRAWLNANFRDEYYGMAPAVGDHFDGPRLITSGLIDPGRSLWGERPVTFAKQQFAAPRIDTAKLEGKMVRWAARRLAPKVLVANQTTVIEAVCDPGGDWLPAVPVVGIYPESADADTAWQIAALLTSPVASAWAWKQSGGTGLSANSIRLGPVLLAALPWPPAGLNRAVEALQRGDIRRCGLAVIDSYEIAGVRDELFSWWAASLDRIEARQPRL